VERQIAIQYMKNHMGNNKALGLLAQAEFERWAHSNPSIRARWYGRKTCVCIPINLSMILSISLSVSRPI